MGARDENVGARNKNVGVRYEMAAARLYGCRELRRWDSENKE